MYWRKHMQHYDINLFLFLIAMWAALAEVLPDVEIHGCHFHHRQRIMKRVKEVEGNLIIEKKDKNYVFLAMYIPSESRVPTHRL